MYDRDFPGSPVAKSLAANAGITGSTSGPGTKIAHGLGNQAHAVQPLSPRTLEPMLLNRRSHQTRSSCTTTRESPPAATDPVQPKINRKNKDKKIL